MSAILLAFDGPQAGEWLALLRARARGREVRAWPNEIGDRRDIAYACVWLPPRGLLATLPNLKAIINIGAGVDALLGDPTLPHLPILRAAHPDLTRRVVGYVVMHALRFVNRSRLYDQQQRARLWRPHVQPSPAEISVGIMGLGVIGCAAASALANLSFQVAGWSRTPKSMPGIDTFHGAAGLDPFLARTDILVCLLPSTSQTDGLLNLDLFRKLRHSGAAGGVYLINAGRGSLQVDGDILCALDEGTLAGAALDVFPQEPLPSDNRLWIHPAVTITPHVAGDIAPAAFADHIIAQIERCERDLPLAGLIDRSRGY